MMMIDPVFHRCLLEEKGPRMVAPFTVLGDV
jgi:hypothetical protein